MKNHPATPCRFKTSLIPIKSVEGPIMNIYVQLLLSKGSSKIEWTNPSYSRWQIWRIKLRFKFFLLSPVITCRETLVSEFYGNLAFSDDEFSIPQLFETDEIMVKSGANPGSKGKISIPMVKKKWKNTFFNEFWVEWAKPKEKACKFKEF